MVSKIPATKPMDKIIHSSMVHQLLTIIHLRQITLSMPSKHTMNVHMQVMVSTMNNSLYKIYFPQERVRDSSGNPMHLLIYKISMFYYKSVVMLCFNEKI